MAPAAIADHFACFWCPLPIGVLNDDRWGIVYMTDHRRTQERLVVIGGSAGVVHVIEGELPREPKRGRPRKYTQEDRAVMRRLKRAGRTNREIARVFGCSPATVSRVVREDKG